MTPTPFAIESTIYAYDMDGNMLYVSNPTLRGENMDYVKRAQAKRARAIFTANCEVASVTVKNYQVLENGTRFFLGSSYDIVAQGTI